MLASVNKSILIFILEHFIFPQRFKMTIMWESMKNADVCVCVRERVFDTGLCKCNEL